MSKLYIERQIRLSHEVVSETELLRRAKLIVVLAEPGAGKTDFLTNIAKLLGAESVRAARFRTNAYTPSPGPVVIDAMDEVARIGENELNDIIVKASNHFTGTAIFASRSGEWETARTKFVEECFRLTPTLIHLEAFNRNEQKLLFENEFPGENFEAFATEADRFDLTPLLGNPEFLQLFGHAYLENDRRFSGKLRIYSDAAKRLGQETNESRSTRGRPDVALMIKQAGSVFARLLLSGASGISLKERIDDRNYPYTGIVAAEVSGGLDYLLDSKLFKPAANANEHEPVHRIVAEFLSAQYLVSRISDTSDSLSLKRCMAIIAPNGVVRDELRGLLGWMAALGGDAIQKAGIEIDPYAVLSNGDPAQLSTANRLLLIERLKDLAETDPYFRRGDVWRSFNVGQFFSEETVTAIKPILASRNKSHLRDLVLELIRHTPVVARLADDLQALALDREAPDPERIEAFHLLLDLDGYDVSAVFDPLFSEGSPISLQILVEAVAKRGLEALGFQKVVSLLRALTSFYPKNQGPRRRIITSRHFIKEFLRAFPASGIAEYLDEMTGDFQCTCNAEHSFACECGYGISKIVGGLLDRYFDVNTGPYDAARIWRWTRNLRFSNHLRVEDSSSVRVLSANHELRQTIQREAFTNTNSLEECKNISFLFYGHRFHSGLAFQSGDVEVTLQQAFEENRIDLWETLSPQHRFMDSRKGPDSLRQKARSHARQKNDVLKIWAKRERAAKLWWQDYRHEWSNRDKRYARREEKAKADTFKHLNDNRALIESGQHWWWLKQFGQYYLYQPEKFDEIVDNVETAYRALRNCFPILSEYLPTLEKLANREGSAIAMVLHASCLLRWRECGNLDDISLGILEAVKTETGTLPGLEKAEAADFNDEIDRLLFRNTEDKEQFIRRFVEPSLSQQEEAFTNVEWLKYKTPFQCLRSKLPLEWLRRFPDMPSQAERALFKMAAKDLPRDDVRALIEECLERYLPEPLSGVDQAFRDRRLFWLLNSFFYDGKNEDVWSILTANRDSLLSIADRSDGLYGANEDWSRLPAEQLYKVLDAFIGQWPKVSLPSSFGTGDPPEERAYRYLCEIPWHIGRDTPEAALPVLDRILADERFIDFQSEMLAVKANSMRKIALGGFCAPLPAEISAMLERKAVASVEDMRALMVEALKDVEAQIRHSETDTLETFYPNGERVDENTARNRLVEHLRGYMTAQSLSVVIEHHMASGNRCDFTATEMIAGRRRLLTIEVKGQWHPELFSAAAAQLDTRYSSNPDAERQGIYLVLWFGGDELVADRKNTQYPSPVELRGAIIEAMPLELRGRIDVVAIDLSRSVQQPAKKSANPRKPRRGPLPKV